MDGRITYQREITSLSAQDSFLVMNRVRDTFDYPVHFHPEMELNLIVNGEGMRRTVGFSSEVIDNYELVLVGPNVYHGWAMHQCNHSVHEVTIQFHNDLFSGSLLQRSLMRSLKDMAIRQTTSSSRLRERIARSFIEWRMVAPPRISRPDCQMSQHRNRCC